MFYILFWFFFFKQKTAYEMRISDWSSDVCSSDLRHADLLARQQRLLGKAEALDLGEIFARLEGRDVEGRGAGDRARRIVARDENRHVARADAHSVERMIGIEFTRQFGYDIGIDAQRHPSRPHLVLGCRGNGSGGVQ